jgi:putative ABC transport system permease protein
MGKGHAAGCCAPFWPDMENGPRGNLFLRVVGRMRPEATLAEAREDVAAIARNISRELGSTRQLTAIGLQADGVREIRGPLIALFAGVAILLLIASVNVAGLLVGRAVVRSHEVALRLALGAGAGRLVRLFLVEGVLLAAAGGAAGVFAGYAGLRALIALAPESLSRLEASKMDLGVLAFAATAAAGLLFSLAPALELLRRSALGRPLAGNWRTSTLAVRRRSRAALTTIQVALSVVLLVGAGLLVRTFVEVLRVDPGFRSEQRLTFRIAVPGRYETREAFNAFARTIQQRIAALPGVIHAGAISHLPYADMPNWSLLYGPETDLPPNPPSADTRAISTDLLETLGIDPVEGRFFRDEDDNPKEVPVIVDDRLARELWPDRSALGQRLTTSVAGMNAPIGAPNARLSVVGVVPHLRLRSLVEDFRPQIFLPWRIAQRNPMALVVATAGDPIGLAAEVRAAIASIDPLVAIYDVRPLRAYVEEARSARRFTMLLASTFAVLALALSSIGVYGVLAYAVAQRRQEIGVRSALGATAGHLTRGILREVMGSALAGCAAGLAVAAATAPLLQSQLYGVHPRDPLACGAAVVLIGIATALACWIPARRATAVSPMDALRSNDA